MVELPHTILYMHLTWVHFTCMGKVGKEGDKAEEGKREKEEKQEEIRGRRKEFCTEFI